jgi:hypothetical protein
VRQAISILRNAGFQTHTSPPQAVNRASYDIRERCGSGGWPEPHLFLSPVAGRQPLVVGGWWLAVKPSSWLSVLGPQFLQLCSCDSPFVRPILQIRRHEN